MSSRTRRATSLRVRSSTSTLDTATQITSVLQTLRWYTGRSVSAGKVVIESTRILMLSITSRMS